MKNMIYLGSDHRGYELKEKIKKWLLDWGYQSEDCGAFEYDEKDDYPDFVHGVAQKVSADPENSKAIILGGSGQGEAMVANRYKGVRAAVFYGPPFQFKMMSWSKWLILGSGGLNVAQKSEFSVLQKLVKLSREHNDANVLSLGASFVDDDVAQKIIKLWLETPFSGEERHIRRLGKIEDLKND